MGVIMTVESRFKELFSSLGEVIFLKEASLIEEQIASVLNEMARILGALCGIFYLVNEDDADILCSYCHSEGRPGPGFTPDTLMQERILHLIESSHEGLFHIMSEEEIKKSAISLFLKSFPDVETKELILIKSESLNNITGLLLFLTIRLQDNMER